MVRPIFPKGLTPHARTPPETLSPLNAASTTLSLRRAARRPLLRRAARSSDETSDRSSDEPPDHDALRGPHRCLRASPVRLHALPRPSVPTPTRRRLPQVKGLFFISRNIQIHISLVNVAVMSFSCLICDVPASVCTL